jgi:predicted DsbA family dithiol-disulfide isomerase
VPFFIINGQWTLSGAQLPAAFDEAFRQAVASE